MYIENTTHQESESRCHRAMKTFHHLLTCYEPPLPLLLLTPPSSPPLLPPTPISHQEIVTGERELKGSPLVKCIVCIY